MTEPVENLIVLLRPITGWGKWVHEKGIGQPKESKDDKKSELRILQPLNVSSCLSVENSANGGSHKETVEQGLMTYEGGPTVPYTSHRATNGGWSDVSRVLRMKDLDKPLTKNGRPETFEGVGGLIEWVKQKDTQVTIVGNKDTVR